MNWKQVDTKEEFEKIYPYSGKPPKDKYPDNYPCLCMVVEYDGGLMGYYKSVEKVYPPEWLDIESFKCGLEVGTNYKT